MSKWVVDELTHARKEGGAAKLMLPVDIHTGQITPSHSSSTFLLKVEACVLMGSREALHYGA
jgi:hypothetical protein